MAGFLNTTLYSPTHPLLLRNPQPEDAAALSQILSEPRNIEFDPHASSSGLSPAVCSSVITRMRASAADAVPTRVNLLVVLLPAVGCKDAGVGEVIGISGFGGIDVVDGKRFGDVGAMLNPEYRGKRFAVECLRLSMEFAFRDLGVDGVSAGCLVRNTPMITLFESKLGWFGERSEGEFGESWKGILSPEEWIEMKKRMGW
ncbi:hypothetical protein BP5796_11501 [Coleophoma crateriformis]|uniref:N-acetyltransferase domain-containing protein n=1 Tax=Coleophoma crateriformis TaxID=565419 RepID=A0A3D8QIK0_9HELO|nr:hypothetical protein BP5796_11501 [Coleophoma crateriformis]